MNKKHSRRGVLKTMASAGALIVANEAMAATTTQSATTQADAVATEDLVAMERALGREFSEADRKMMAEGVTANRKKLRGLRDRTIPPDVEPAVHFDPRLPGMTVPTGKSLCRVSTGEAPAYDGNVESLAFLTVVELSRLIRAKEVSSLELTKMYLGRLKTIGQKLNCVITLTEELALAQAKRADEELAAGKNRGPLHGIPWGAKDLLATKGIATTWGASPYANQVFDYDATVVKKLEEAGAVLCAKLSLGELAMGDVWYKGMTRTPWDPKKGSSGSSAGPGAAVAAGLVAFAIGSETMGSIISPCVTNGITGLRPTYGRVSRYGAMALSRTMDKLGPMARCVEDCAIVLHAIHGADGLDATAADVPFQWVGGAEVTGLRVGYNASVFDEMKKSKVPARRDAYAAALEKVREIAGELVPVTLPDAKPYAGISGLIISVESAASFSELVTSGKVRELKQQDAGSWPNTFRQGALIPASDYLRAQQVRTMLQREMAEKVFSDVDCYLNIPFAGPTMAFTNLTGHPTLIARCGVVEGRPIMLEIVGDLYGEDMICSVGQAYERATGWTKLWPDTALLRS